MDDQKGTKMSMTAYTIHEKQVEVQPPVFFMYYRDKCRSVSGNRFDQVDNGIDGILLRRNFSLPECTSHGSDKGP